MLKKFSLVILTMSFFILLSSDNERTIQQNHLAQPKGKNIITIKVHEEITEKEKVNKMKQNKVNKISNDADWVSCRRLLIELDNEDFYQKFVENPKAGVTESTIKKIEETNQDVFMKREYASDIFPASFVYKLQEILYDVCVNDIEVYGNELLDVLGGEQYELSKEESREIFQEEAEYYDGIYRFFLDGNREAYLFRFDMGGAGKEYYMTLKVRNGKGLDEIASFGTLYHPKGRVIKDGGNYYYIFFQHNYNLKCNDGIRAYRLNENAGRENILVRYIPEEYVWENLYMTEDKLVRDYVENIRDVITSEEYIERGARYNYYNVMEGDETKDTEDLSTEGNKEFYKIDFTNTGIPVYIERVLYEPSNSYQGQICLKFSFYLYNTEKEEMVKFDALNFDNNDKTANGLLQMWFKEFNGKVYTFQLYAMDDFSYMLNVFLVERGRITPVRVDYILPKRTIVVEEY